MLEIWEVILQRVACLKGSVNLILAHKGLYESTRSDLSLWKRLEAQVAFYNSYKTFSRRLKHLGVRRRLIAWVAMTRDPCCGCGNDYAMPLYYLGIKLCTYCMPVFTVTHADLERRLGPRRARAVHLPFSWIDMGHGKKEKVYHRKHLMQLGLLL